MIVNVSTQRTMAQIPHQAINKPRKCCEANPAWIWAFGLEDAQVAPELREDERH